MALVKQAIQLALGSVDQKYQSKFLPPGRLSVAENVYQSKTRSYRKRGGFGLTDRLTDTGTISTGKDLALSGTTPVMRTADSVYARPAATWVKRGAYIPVTPAYSPLIPNIAARPLMVVTGTQTWVFAQASDGTYHYSVFDAGVQVVAPVQVSATTALHARAVSTAGKVWLFFGPASTGTNTIKLAMFATASPATAPTVTNFAAPTGATFDAWDVLDAGANNNGIVMAICSSDGGGLNFGGGAAALFCGRLDTATGLVDGTGWVAATGVALGQPGSPMSWVRSVQSATLLHLLWRRPSNSHIFLTTVTASTLASTSADTTAQLASQKGGISAYRESATGNVVLFVSNNNTPTPGVENSTISRYSWSGAALTGLADAFHRAMSVVSDPFFVDGAPYIVALHDDGQNLQNAYYVLDASAAPGRILARALYQLGGTIWQRADRVNGNDHWDNNFLVPVVVAGHTAQLAVGSVLSGTYTLMSLTLDFAPTDLAQPTVAQDGQEIIFAGGWSMVLSGGGALADITPGMFPRGSWTATAAAGAGTLTPGTFLATVCYVLIDQQGNLQRSAYSPVQSVVIAGTDVVRFSGVPTLRMLNDSARVFIELNLSAADGEQIFLVSRRSNSTAADVIADVDIGTDPAAGSEIIYTDGGGLDHISAPPFKWAATWRRRVFLGGTDSPVAEVWPSFELASGFGPSWNETLLFRVPGGTGKDTAGCAVDYNYFAIFKEDSVWVISGDGPDPLGSGSYGSVVQQVVDAPGCSNPRSVVQTPQGCMYQARSGEIWLVTRSGTAQFISAPWDDHVGATVTSAVHSSELSFVVFYTSTSKALVWDYGSPLPEEGSLGQGYVWHLVAAPVGAAAARSTLAFLDATGVMRSYSAASYTDDTNTAILRRVKVPLLMGGIRGYARLYRLQVVGQWKAVHSLKVTVDSFAGVAAEAGSATQSWTKAVTAGPELFEARPNQGRATALDITVEDVGTDLTEGATLDGIGLEVGIKQGLPRLNTTQRM
jgi:hypothetical protein